MQINNRPFRFWVQSILPLVYDDSLSYYEVLCKVTKKLNEIIENLSGIDDEIKEEVVEYVNSDAIKELIESIVSEYVPEENIMNFSSKTVDVNRIISDIRINNPQNQGSYYVVPQSMCYVPKNNSLIVLYVPNIAIFQTTCELVEYSLDNKTVLRNTVIAGGHGNGCSYNPDTDEIYICTLNKATIEGVESDCLSVFDYTTLNLKTNIPFISRPIGVSYYQDNIYVRLDGNQIFVLDENYNVTRSMSLKGPEYKGSVEQDIEVHDDLIYALNWRPNTIDVYDLSGNNVANYNIPEWWNKYYRIHECEGIAYIGDDYFAVNAVSMLGGTSYLFACNIGVTSFKYGMIEDEAGFARMDLGIGAGSAMNVYVDTTYTGLAPNGTTEAPFRNAQEAIESLHSPWADRYAIIHLSGEEEYTLDIRGIYCPISFQGTYTFKAGVFIQHTENIEFNSSQTIRGTGKSYSVDLTDCTVLLGAHIVEGSTGGLVCVNSEVSVKTEDSFKINTSSSKLQLLRSFDTTKVTLTDGLNIINRPIKLTGEIVGTETFTPSSYLARFNRVMGIFRERESNRFYTAYASTPSANEQSVLEFFMAENSFIGIICCRLALYGSGTCQFSSIVKYPRDGSQQTAGFPADFVCEALYGIS